MILLAHLLNIGFEIENIEKTDDLANIECSEETDDLLTQKQILAMLEQSPIPTQPDQPDGHDEIDDSDETFQPEDFGLTEEDINAHEEIRRQRKAYVKEKLGGKKLKPLDPELIQRLDLLKSVSEIDPLIPAIDEPTLKELDAAILHNMEMFIPDEAK